MPVDHRWDESSRTLRTRCWGHVANEDLLKQALVIARDPKIVQPLKELIDLREVRSTTVTMDGLRNVVRIDAEYAEKFKDQKTAIVAPTDDLFSLAQTFASLSEMYDAPTSVRIFRDHAEAEQWLASLA